MDKRMAADTIGHRAERFLTNCLPAPGVRQASVAAQAFRRRSGHARRTEFSPPGQHSVQASGLRYQYRPPAWAMWTLSGHASPPISTGFIGTRVRLSLMRAAT